MAAWLTIGEAAREVRRSRTFVHNLIKSGMVVAHDVSFSEQRHAWRICSGSVSELKRLLLRGGSPGDSEVAVSSPEGEYF